MMFSQGKITKDELDKAGKIESDLNMLEDKSKAKNTKRMKVLNQTTILRKTKTQINRF